MCWVGSCMILSLGVVCCCSLVELRISDGVVYGLVWIVDNLAGSWFGFLLGAGAYVCFFV